MAEQFVAEYLRISLQEIEDAMLDDIKKESYSIQHQRDLIRQYRDDKKLYPEMQALEFVDDGHSGTGFERPAVKQMLSMVREGKISCILVKDISRFGRNYLEVGDYLEQIFPFLGVRFIAINDGYDSDDYVGTTGGIDIAFRSFLYDMYSKDLSTKMRSAMKVRMKRGDFVGTRPPFGYQFSDDRRVLAVDEEAAQYVKKIFRLACEGYTTGKIAKKLNEEKIPTPGQYWNKKKGMKEYRILDGEGYWNCDRVLKILKNKVYLGTIVNGKGMSTKVASRQHIRRTTEEEQICVPGRHEAIITEQEYQQALKVIRIKKYQAGKGVYERQEGILSGKLRCGNCHRKMVRKVCGNRSCYICDKAYFDKNSGCVGQRVKETELEAVVMEHIIRKQEKERQHQEQAKIFSGPDSRKVLQEIAELEKSRESVKMEKQYLYEQFKQKQIARESYLKRIETLREKDTNLCERIKQAQEELSSRGGQREDKVSGDGVMGLTREMVEQLIETVYVYDEKKIEIVWKEKTA